MYQGVIQQQQDNDEHMMNYLTDEMESVVGMSGILPRFPERRRVLNMGEVTLNNIQVSNSEIGVLNTGNIHNVDVTLTVLKTEGNPELAEIVKTLTETVIKSGEISNNIKNQIIELLNALSEEAIVPKEKLSKPLCFFLVSRNVLA